jgi:hypothetical protein
MKKFLLAIAVLLLFSCSASKRSSQTRTDNSINDSTVSIIDTSSKVTVEETKEVTTLQGDSITFEVPLTSVDTIITVDTQSIAVTPSTTTVQENKNFKVKVTVDKGGKNAKIQIFQKPQEVVKTSKKTIVEKVGKSETAAVNSKTDIVVKDKEKVPKTNWTLIIIVLIAIVVLGVLIYLKVPSLRLPGKKTPT